jgi:hypothetical protein
MKLSGMFKLSAKDLFKGLIVAAISTAVSSAYELLSSGPANFFEWGTLGTIGGFVGVAVLSYLLKNLFTNTQGEFATADPIVK